MLADEQSRPCLDQVDAPIVEPSRALALSRRALLMAVAAGCMAPAAGLLGCSSGEVEATREVTDMAGRTVSVPKKITRVFCTNPIGTVDIYALDPDLLCGWNFLPSGDNRSYIPDEYLELPALGVWMGSGSTPNAEEIAAQDPDVLLCFWTADEAGSSMADSISEDTGLPVLVVDYDIRSVEDAYGFAGELLDREDRASELGDLCRELLDRARAVVDAVPEAERKSIFLAQGKDGLTTDPVGSMHVTDALEWLDVENVADMPGTEGQGMGMPSVNLEQVVSWNPDAVLVAEYSMSDAESSDIYGQILQDDAWANVPAVASGQVFRIPQAPFSWFGRPPSAMRALGCLWLACRLYPDYAVDIDLAAEARAFYQAFLGIEIDDDRLGELLSS